MLLRFSGLKSDAPSEGAKKRKTKPLSRYTTAEERGKHCVLSCFECVLFALLKFPRIFNEILLELKDE